MQNNVERHPVDRIEDELSSLRMAVDAARLIINEGDIFDKNTRLEMVDYLLERANEHTDEANRWLGPAMQEHRKKAP
jgi:hypothetical protein